VALAAVGAVDAAIVGLDADVKNSTFSDKFEKVAPGDSTKTSLPNR
jgi:transketolase C-terminal domain/subunit